MKTPITPEALIELGFSNSNLDEYTYYTEDSRIEKSGVKIEVYPVAGSVWVEDILTNATTIKDIKDLIRLFK